ncbi:MAG: hypothetical protein O9262_09820, partial [Cyclobacteriaceae bacterium]|nr:hypothetical protein [Cyclobacteriaceae bacterium]
EPIPLAVIEFKINLIMEDKFYILFCESPFQANKVDEEFEDQFASAKENGFEIILVNYVDLISSKG